MTYSRDMPESAAPSEAIVSGAEPLAQTAGRAWVDRYLEPLLKARWGASSAPLSCMQLWGDDDEEAEQLRTKGHRCVVWMPPGVPHSDWTWYQPPVLGKSRTALPFPDASFDVVFSSAFGRLAQSAMQRDALAKELARVLRPGGALLLSIGNRWCPIDMQDRAAFLHGPWHPEKASLRDLESRFTACGFSSVERLSVDGHFRWARVPRLLRPLARLVGALLAWTSKPSRRWVYASPLNTMFMLWISR